MTDRKSWEHEQLMAWKDEVLKRFEKLDEWQRDHDKFKTETIQQLLVIFEKLKDLQEGDKWIKRMFTTALVGTALSAIAALMLRFM